MLVSLPRRRLGYRCCAPGRCLFTPSHFRNGQAKKDGSPGKKGLSGDCRIPPERHGLDRNRSIIALRSPVMQCLSSASIIDIDTDPERESLETRRLDKNPGIDAVESPGPDAMRPASLPARETSPEETLQTMRNTKLQFRLETQLPRSSWDKINERLLGIRKCSKSRAEELESLEKVAAVAGFWDKEISMYLRDSLPHRPEYGIQKKSTEGSSDLEELAG